MKILLYSLNFAPELTGIGKYSGEMATWLAQQGHQVQVVCAVPYYPQWQVQEGWSRWRWQRTRQVAGAGTLDVRRCPLWVPSRPSGMRRILHLLSFTFSSLPPLAWRVLVGRPDLVFVVAPALLAAPQAMVLARLAGRPAWLHVQDFEVDAALDLGLVRPGRLGQLARRVEAWLLRRFHRVSTISEAMLTRLHAKGVPQARTALLPNWVDLQAIRPPTAAERARNDVRTELGLGPADRLLLYAGNMGEKQGLDVVIEAARRLRHRSDLRFLMVGTGAAAERLRTSAADLRNMIWWPLQPVQRLNTLLGAADIHLLPQRGDVADLVMPSKLGGMLASGRLVIGTARAGTELGRVLDAVGVRVEPGDAAALAAALELHASDIDALAHRGMAGRAHAEQTLGVTPVLSRFVAQAAALAASAVPGARQAKQQ